jgi:hypothetical protein
MNQIFSSRRTLAAALTLVALSSGCTMKNQEAPPLTGPSELGTAITVSVAPDILTQDGGSQSLVTVSAYDSNGKPLRNLSMRSEIVIGGVIADFGTLSARSIVTGSDGRATFVYTAPAAPAGPAVDNGTTVSISVTPLGNDSVNSVARFASIRLVPSGVVVPPDGLQPKFTVSNPTPADHENVIFDASTSTSNVNNPITKYTWDFGDGDSGSGRTTTHSYDGAGTFVAKLTVSDAFNRSASTSVIVTVAGITEPTADFTFSPTDPKAPADVHFNASSSIAPSGRTIVSYIWEFGKGESPQTTSGPQVTVHYDAVATYTVTLTVIDSAGQRSIARNRTVTVGKPAAP